MSRRAPAPGASENATERRRRAASARTKLRLDRRAIIDVTLRIVDADGVDGVSMRRVAAEFDTGPASLYAYVATKDELLRAAYDAVAEDIEVPCDGAWPDVVRAWATSQRQVMGAHGDLARVGFGHVPTGPRMLEILERLLQAMARDSVPRRVAAWAVDTISLYLTAHVYEDFLFRHAPAGADGVPDSVTSATSQFGALGRAQFPQVWAHLPAMTTGDHHARFHFGLDLLIGGIKQAAASPSLG